MFLSDHTWTLCHLNDVVSLVVVGHVETTWFEHKWSAYLSIFETERVACTNWRKSFSTEQSWWTCNVRQTPGIGHRLFGKIGKKKRETFTTKEASKAYDVPLFCFVQISSQHSTYAQVHLTEVTGVEPWKAKFVSLCNLRSSLLKCCAPQETDAAWIACKQG